MTIQGPLTAGADVIKCPPVGVWAWEAPTTQDTEVGAQWGQGHTGTLSVSHNIDQGLPSDTAELRGLGASYQDDNMASGGYGYGGDVYDDDEYPAAKPYPHPGTVTVRHLVRVKQLMTI